MKTKMLLLISLLVLAPAWVFAIPIASPCTTGTLTDYLNLTAGCTIGDKTFADFTYTSSGTLGLNSDQITVTPVDSGGEFGFNFTAAWSAFGVNTADSLIGYDITAGTGFLITDAELSMLGFGATNIAQVSVADNFSNGVNLFVSYNPTCALSNTCVTSTSATFAGVSSLTVAKDIALTTSGAGTAALSLVSNTVSQSIPEPATLSLLGLGLLGLGAGLRRKLSL